MAAGVLTPVPLLRGTRGHSVVAADLAAIVAGRVTRGSGFAFVLAHPLADRVVRDTVLPADGAVLVSASWRMSCAYGGRSTRRRPGTELPFGRGARIPQAWEQ
jgi:hypothetical protein